MRAKTYLHSCVSFILYGQIVLVVAAVIACSRYTNTHCEHRLKMILYRQLGPKNIRSLQLQPPDSRVDILCVDLPVNIDLRKLSISNLFPLVITF